MGRLAVYKFAYFLSILFTFFILGLSIFAYFSGKINPAENMFAAYVALSKPILVATNAILFIYWLIRLRYWLWIPLTSLMVNYGYIISMYQIYNPTKYANENRLKVVTYNVHSFGNHGILRQRVCRDDEQRGSGRTLFSRIQRQWGLYGAGLAGYVC